MGDRQPGFRCVASGGPDSSDASGTKRRRLRKRLSAFLCLPYPAPSCSTPAPRPNPAAGRSSTAPCRAADITTVAQRLRNPETNRAAGQARARLRRFHGGHVSDRRFYGGIAAATAALVIVLLVLLF